MALHHVDPVIHCSLPLIFSSLKIVFYPGHSTLLSLFLYYGSFLGTDQVYDPVSLNQNKAHRDKQIKCSFDKAPSFVYCQTSSNLFLCIYYAQQISVLET